MPYVTLDARRKFDDGLIEIERAIQRKNGMTEGELNYVITQIVRMYVGSPRYSSLNAAIGVLECAKLELYRRLAAPYEDTKIAENGDVY